MNRGTYSEEEIEALITGTERGLIRFAMRYLKDHAGACDAVQDAYIRYVRFLQGPPPGVVENPEAPAAEQRYRMKYIRQESGTLIPTLGITVEF